jgi:Mg-chelatase subunit ChlD
MRKTLNRYLAGALVAALVIAGTARPTRAYYDDIHYGLTFFLARMIGYTQEQAYRAASATVAIDWDPQTEPVQGGEWYAGAAPPGYRPIAALLQSPIVHVPRWRFHAFRNELAFSNVVGNGPGGPAADRMIIDQRSALWARGLEIGNPGVFMHFFQDEVPHAKYGTGGGHWPIVTSGAVTATEQQGLPIGGSTDWLSFRSAAENTALVDQTVAYLTSFMRQTTPTQRVRPLDRAIVARLIQALRDVNPAPTPLHDPSISVLRDAEAMAAAGIMGKDAALGHFGNRVNLSPEEIENIRRQRAGPVFETALEKINEALQQAGFRSDPQFPFEKIPPQSRMYDYDGYGNLAGTWWPPAGPNPDPFVLVGELTVNVLDLKPQAPNAPSPNGQLGVTSNVVSTQVAPPTEVTVTVRMGKSKVDDEEYALGEMRVMPGTPAVFPKMPVGELVVELTVGGGKVAARETVFLLTQKRNITVNFSSAALKGTPADCDPLIAQAKALADKGDAAAAQTVLKEASAKCAGSSAAIDKQLDDARLEVEEELKAILGRIGDAWKLCSLQAALDTVEELRAAFSPHPILDGWLTRNEQSLIRDRQLQKDVEPILRDGEAAIRANDLEKAVAKLKEAYPKAPDCVKVRIDALLPELEARLRFVKATKDAEAASIACDFQKAKRSIEDVRAINPREPFMDTWLTENTTKIDDLLKREEEATDLKAQADRLAATATTPVAWDAVIAALEQAAQVAPTCVGQKLNLDGARIDAKRKRDPLVDNSFLLLIDTSGSMEASNKMENAKTAARQAVRAATVSTEMAVWAFGGGCGAGAVWEVQGFTSDQAKLLSAIDGLKPSGGTPMYVAVGVAVDAVAKKARGRLKMVVLLSDGADSCRDQQAAASNTVRTSQIPVTTIGFDVGADKQAQDDLTNLSTMSGGRTFSASAADPKEVVRAFSEAMLPSLMKTVDPAAQAGGPAVQQSFRDGQALLMQRNLPGALSKFQDAARLAPQSAAANYNLSLLYEANDQLIPAMNAANTYLQLAPAAADRADVQARIRNIEDELRRNPRAQFDPAACQDLYAWAQTESDVARRSGNTPRRQAILTILVASQKGDCANAQRLAEAYRRLYIK